MVNVNQKTLYTIDMDKQPLIIFKQASAKNPFGREALPGNTYKFIISIPPRKNLYITQVFLMKSARMLFYSFYKHMQAAAWSAVPAFYASLKRKHGKRRVLFKEFFNEKGFIYSCGRSAAYGRMSNTE